MGYQPLDSGSLHDSVQAWNDALLIASKAIDREILLRKLDEDTHDEQRDTLYPFYMPDCRCTTQEAIDGLVSVFGGSKIDLSLTNDISLEEAFRHATTANPFAYIGTQINNWLINFLAHFMSRFHKPEQNSGGQSNSATLALLNVIDQEIASRQHEPRLGQYEDAAVGYEEC